MTGVAVAPVLPDHPALAPVGPLLDALGVVGWPEPGDWSRLAAKRGIRNAPGMQLAFVAPSDPAPSALDFERRIHEHGEVETRPQCWHDAFHACAWLAFPRTKARINALHVADGADASPNRRSSLRNFLTLFDEGGIIVASTRPDLLDLLRGFRWRALFSDRRQAVRDTMDFVIFGHALYERALSMHYGATGKGILLEVGPDYFSLDLQGRLAFLDVRIEALISDPAFEPRTRFLQPVPIKGIPGWDAANEDPAYYDDVAQFRPRPAQGSLMLAILNVTAPFFALIACGYGASRYRLLPENAVPALNTFVLYFALPCMMFRFTLETPIAQIFSARVFLAYMVGGLMTFAIFVYAYRFATGERLHRGAYPALAVSWSNWGYMGFALIPVLLGKEALPVIVAGGMADLFVVLSVGLALGGVGTGGTSFRSIAVGAVMRVVKNPMIWAVILGAIGSGLGVKLPSAPDQLVRLLGSAAVPVALFAIGVSLYRPGVPVLRADVMMITGAKLLLQPYMVAIAAIHLVGLSGFQMHVLVLMAALPVAGSVFLFAERAGSDSEAISGSILVSTALAFFSFSALCWAMGLELR